MTVAHLFLATLFLAYVTYDVQGALTDASDCSHVKTFYDAQDFSNLFLAKAESADQLKVCTAVDFTCCSTQAENRLFVEGVKDSKHDLENGTTAMAVMLKNFGRKLDQYLTSLIDKSGKQLDDLFVETYDQIYMANKAVFTKFFDDLKIYYQGGVIDLTDIFDSLFSSLTQIAFELYPTYNINDEYMECIGDNMHVILPFAELPRKLENNMRRSVIAMRTYLQALAYGQHLIESVSQMHPSPVSINEYISMTHCARCAGYVVDKPCPSLCEKTMHTVLCNLYGDFSEPWNNYIDAMNVLINRMEGPFDIEDATSIDVKISAGIMVLQDNEGPIASAVERVCGPIPRKSLASSNQSFIDINAIDLSALSNFDANNYAPRNERSKRSTRNDRQRNKKKRRARGKKSRSSHSTRDITASRRPHGSKQSLPNSNKVDLDNLIAEMRNTQKILKTYWRNLPVNICSNIVAVDSDHCWNGNTVVSIDTNSKNEAKKRCPANVKPDPTFRIEISNLKSITSKLEQAYRGIDTSMPDREDFNEDSSGDGSGDDSPENEKPEGDSSTRKPPRTKPHSPENIPKTPNKKPSEDKGELVGSLQDWEIEILEAVLARDVSRRELLKELKGTVLQRHPHLKHKQQEKEKLKIGDLTENQIMHLKKMLGIQHSDTSGKDYTNSEKSSDADKDKSEDNIVAVTPRSHVEKTTSAAYSLQSCPLVLLITFVLLHLTC